VIWYSRRKKHFVIQSFDNDLASATKLYIKVKGLGAPLATLRCCNVGFPPPVEYRPYVQQRVVKEKRNGRVRKRLIEEEIVPMEGVNLKGVWWCPYCREMRRFKLQDGATYEGIFVEGRGMYCPVCEIAHVDHHVRKWNPQAERLVYEVRRQTKGNRRGSRRRTRKHP